MDIPLLKMLIEKNALPWHIDEDWNIIDSDGMEVIVTEHVRALGGGLALFVQGINALPELFAENTLLRNAYQKEIARSFLDASEEIVLDRDEAERMAKEKAKESLEKLLAAKAKENP